MKIFLYVLLFFGAFGAEGVDIDQDLTLTTFQKSILDKFKGMVEPVLPEEYMKQEIYLIRWLRTCDYDLDAAREMLINNIKWRKENRMDQILSEDWTEVEDSFGSFVQGYDKQGRPVIETNVGTWDLRSAMLAGERRTVMRLLDKRVEEMTTLVRKLQAEGKNVTQYYHIYNIDGYNLVQHSCPQCIATLTYGLQSYNNHYPGSAHKVVLVNTPTIFEPLLQILKSGMTRELRETVHVFGRNKKEWQKFLFDDIPKSQLSTHLGGTLVNPAETLR